MSESCFLVLLTFTPLQTDFVCDNSKTNKQIQQQNTNRLITVPLLGDSTSASNAESVSFSRIYFGSLAERFSTKQSISIMQWGKYLQVPRTSNFLAFRDLPNVHKLHSLNYVLFNSADFKEPYVLASGDLLTLMSRDWRPPTWVSAKFQPLWVL